MTDADLITLAEREQARLTNEGDNAAAAIMRALVDRVRGMPVTDWLRGVSPDAPATLHEKSWWKTQYVPPVTIISTGDTTISTTVPERLVPRVDRSQDWRNN